MGSWGTGLYQDDIAEEVRDYYIDNLYRGKSGAEITLELLHNYSDVLNDVDDSPIFWFALADTQWKLGRLEDYVKDRALFYIDNGSDIHRWSVESPKEVKKRLKVLTDLKNKLMSTPPPEKKISQYRLYHCEWRIGDVFAYKLESDLAKEKGLYGRFVLIRKVDESVWHPGHIVPVVYFKLTKDDSLPVNIDEYNQEEYIQTGTRKYENGLFSEEKTKYVCEPDEFGFLRQFRASLINTSKRIIPKKLIYLGNFKEAMPPQNEFIPYWEVELSAIMWKNFDSTFESEMISRYFGYNKREYRIYQNIKS